MLDRPDYLKILCTPSPALCSSRACLSNRRHREHCNGAEDLGSNHPDSSDFFPLLSSPALALHSSAVRTYTLP